MKEEIFSLLEELKSLLLEENNFLKRLDTENLMHLIPKKLSLIEQIEHIVGEHDVQNFLNETEKNELKEAMAFLKEQNEKNRFFAEEALGVWSDFLSLLLPLNYKSNGRTEAAELSFKGVSLSMEA